MYVVGPDAVTDAGAVSLGGLFRDPHHYLVNLIIKGVCVVVKGTPDNVIPLSIPIT